MSTSTKLTASSPLANISLKTNEQSFVQVLAYGLTDRLTLSLEAPFSLGAESVFDVNSVTSKVTSDSGSLGVAFNVSILFIEDTEKNTRLGMDVYYNSKAFNNREIGYQRKNILRLGLSSFLFHNDIHCVSFLFLDGIFILFSNTHVYNCRVKRSAGRMKNKSFFHKSEYEDLYFLKETERLIKKIHTDKQPRTDIDNVIELFPNKDSQTSKNKKTA